MTKPTSRKVLLSAPLVKRPVSLETLIEVAKTHGVSPFRQFSHQISRLVASKKSKMAAVEYYEFGMFRPDLSRKDRSEFVGVVSNEALNATMNTSSANFSIGLLRQKVFFSLLMQGLGLPSTRLQAIFSRKARYGNVTTLLSADDLQRFFSKEARYPLFGKPTNGSKSVGSALFESIDHATGQIMLSNGKTVEVASIAQEIAEDYASGYLFEDALIQHQGMQAVAGDALGSVRFVTIDSGAGADVLYALWKLPAPTAMSDNFWQEGSMVAHVDAQTGGVTMCRRGLGLKVEELEAHPVSGLPIVGFQIPHWDAACRLVIDTHRVFQGLGIAGWDVGITQDGPVIIEGNSNPFHTLYQNATGRGIRHPEFAQAFAKVAARKGPQ